MRTWLQRHVHSRPGRILSPALAIGKRRPLSVQITKLSVKSLADDLTIANDHRTNQGVWAYFPAPALRQPKRPPEVLTIRSFKRGVHID